VEYLIKLCDLYHTTNNIKGFEKALLQYKETDLLFYAITSAYYQQDWDHTILEEIKL
jgi:hypothetical protein